MESIDIDEIAVQILAAVAPYCNGVNRLEIRHVVGCGDQRLETEINLDFREGAEFGKPPQEED